MAYQPNDIDNIIAAAMKEHAARGNMDVDESARASIKAYAAANPGKIAAKQRDGWTHADFAGKLTDLLQQAHDNQPAGSQSINAAAMHGVLSDCIC